MELGDDMDPVVLKDRIARRLIEVRAVEFGDFTLASGRKSDVYVNMKRALTHPDILAMCAKAMTLHAPVSEKVAGVALGAVPLAVAISLEANIPYLMIRKKAKEHGMRNLIEGTVNEGDRVFMVEDVTTTAGSAVPGVEALRGVGAEMDTLVVVVDRCEGATETMDNVGVRLIPVLTLDELRAL
jgi:orotate phosphoribosyltransferase